MHSSMGQGHWANFLLCCSWFSGLAETDYWLMLPSCLLINAHLLCQFSSCFSGSLLNFTLENRESNIHWTPLINSWSIDSMDGRDRSKPAVGGRLSSVHLFMEEEKSGKKTQNLSKEEHSFHGHPPWPSLQGNAFQFFCEQGMRIISWGTRNKIWESHMTIQNRSIFFLSHDYQELVEKTVDFPCQEIT